MLIGDYSFLFSGGDGENHTDIDRIYHPAPATPSGPGGDGGCLGLGGLPGRMTVIGLKNAANITLIGNRGKEHPCGSLIQ